MVRHTIPYDPHFLGRGIVVPLPEPSDELRNQLVPVDGSHVLDYVHFSLAMHRERHTAAFSACNIDGSRVVKVPNHDTTWKIDDRLGDYQLGPEAYNNNAWDKGHLTKREDVLWGTPAEARAANDATFYYSNAAPQHGHFNRDEWKRLEDWFFGWASDEDYRLNVITGPVMSPRDRRLSEGDPRLERTRIELDPDQIFIPAVFWKIIAVRHKDTDDLSVAAFAMRQSKMWQDLQGHKLLRLTVHQVSVDAISAWTGLDFGPLHAADVLRIHEERSVFARSAETGDAIWPIISSYDDIIAPPKGRSIRGGRTRIAESASKSGCGCGGADLDVRAVLESLTQDVARVTEAVAAHLPSGGTERSIRAERSIVVDDAPRTVDGASVPTTEEILGRVRFDPQSASLVRIVGGQEVAEGELMSTCCLGTIQQFLCTGILIHPQVVVTAAHCRSNLTRAFFGGPRIPPNGKGQVVRVRSAVVHPRYNSLAFVHNDINVVILNDAVDIEPTPIATTAEIGAATSVELAGFGYNDGVAQLGFGVKRRVTVPMAAVRQSDAQNFSEAERVLGFSSHHEFVAGRKLLGKDSCNGDSGGPAFIEVGGVLKVAGVTSRATDEATRDTPCGSGGIYVRLDVYREWIVEVAASFGIDL
jgi:endonuclease G